MTSICCTCLLPIWFILIFFCKYIAYKKTAFKY